MNIRREASGEGGDGTLEGGLSTEMDDDIATIELAVLGDLEEAQRRARREEAAWRARQAGGAASSSTASSRTAGGTGMAGGTRGNATHQRVVSVVAREGAQPDNMNPSTETRHGEARRVEARRSASSGAFTPGLLIARPTGFAPASASSARCGGRAVGGGSPPAALAVVDPPALTVGLVASRGDEELVASGGATQEELPAAAEVAGEAQVVAGEWEYEGSDARAQPAAEGAVEGAAAEGAAEEPLRVSGAALGQLLSRFANERLDDEAS